MTYYSPWWQPYATTRPDCTVFVQRWGDGVAWGGSAWRAVRGPMRLSAYVSFDRLMSDADALAQLFQALDEHEARVTAEDAHTVTVRQPAGRVSGRRQAHSHATQ